MFKVGVTGGIGSGKSLVCDLFSRLGVPVFNADEVARDIVNRDHAVISEIKSVFGKELYTTGQLNRAKIAELVFQNHERLEELNNIVHPAVAKAYLHWLAQQNAPYTIKEAAIIIETGTYSQLDAVVLVTAPEEIRTERVMQRDGHSKEAVMARIRNQWSDDEKRKHASHLVNNDGSALLLPQVLQLHYEFSMAATNE